MALSGGQRYSAQQIAGSLNRAGFTPSQATTFAGVLHYESRGYTGSFGGQPSENGGALNPNGAFGLAQFNGPRQGALLNFAGSPQAAADLDTQTRFIYKESTAMGINADSHADIVNRYEVPKQSLRAGEIREAKSISAGIDQNQFGTTNGSQTGVNTPAQQTGLTQNPDGSYTFKDNGDGTGSSDFPEIGAEEGSKPVIGGGAASAKGTASSNSATSTSPQGQQNTNTNSSGGGSSAGGSMTVPMAIDAQTRGNASDTSSINSTNRSNTSDINKTNKENTEALNKTSTANTKSGTDKAQSIYDSATGSLSDYFVRLVFIVVGLIALAAALMSFGKPKQLLQMAAKAI